jgi:hypothetical protein
MAGMAGVEDVYLSNLVWYQLKRLVVSDDYHYQN